jgi:hypothetical protein
MAVGTLFQEVSKLTTIEAAGISDLGIRDRLILKLVKDGATSGITLPAGKILVGDSSNLAMPQTPTGVVALSNAGVVSFSTNFAFAATSGTNGEIAVSGMTTNGAVIITPMEACPAVHVVAAAGKVTVFEANTTNVINAKKLAVLILAK